MLAIGFLYYFQIIKPRQNNDAASVLQCMSVIVIHKYYKHLFYCTNRIKMQY